MAIEKQSIELVDDGETGTIRVLTFKCRTLHGQLAAVDADQRANMARDALDLGAEVLARANRHGDLETLGVAIDRLDQESARIVSSTIEHVDSTIKKTVAEMTATMESDDGPLAAILQMFDPTQKDNVIDVVRDLVADTTIKVTRRAVKDLSEATNDTIERLTRSIATIEKVAAADEARLKESDRGTSKGLEHEIAVESLLGELVGVAGDSLDDVSTVPGLNGNKKGDKVITPRNGCAIVSEEKCGARMSESKLRKILEEAMANRGTVLGLLIVDAECKVPGNQPFHFIDDDKVIVVAERQPLRMVYLLFRAKATEIAATRRNLDDTHVVESLETIRCVVANTRRALDRFRSVRTEHTKATKAIGEAGRYLDDLTRSIASDIVDLNAVVDGVSPDERRPAA